LMEVRELRNWRERNRVLALAILIWGERQAGWGERPVSVASALTPRVRLTRSA
jgi:hypothetical protein